MLIFVSSFSIEVVPQIGIFTLEVIDSLLILKIFLFVLMFFTIELDLLLVDDLFESLDLIFEVFSLVLVQFVKIVDMFGLFFDLFLVALNSFAVSIVHVFDLCLKSFDFFPETVGLTIQHLPNRSFFFDHLFDFGVLLVDRAF